MALELSLWRPYRRWRPYCPLIVSFSRPCDHKALHLFLQALK